MTSRLEELSDDFKVALNRRLGSANVRQDEAESEETKAAARAFRRYLRTGKDGLADVERRALTTADDTQAGYLATPAFASELIRLQGEASPLRRLTRPVTITAGSVSVPRQTQAPSASWVGELEMRPETTMKYGMTDVPLHEMAVMIPVSIRFLEDVPQDFDGIVRDALALAFASTESAAILRGDAIKKPLGVLAGYNGDSIAKVASGSGTGITPEALVQATCALPTAFQGNARWLMNRKTSAAVRTLKDNAGRFLWSDMTNVLRDGVQATLLGYPVELCDDMPDIATNSLPILFGDFYRAIWIVGKPNGGVSILVDPFTSRGSGQIVYHARQRVGSALVQPAALIAVKVATS